VVDTATVPLQTQPCEIPEDASGQCPATWHLILGAADGPTVLLVSDGSSVTARVFTVDSAAVPPETTTTTTGPSDDGIVGWPGPTSRQFETAESAAQAFVTDVLGFADPALADLTEEGSEAQAVYHPRPTASITTTIALHHTGTARGWVVTGVTSDQGSIDSVERQGDDVSVAGLATAFEATVNVRLVDVTGAVLGETTTMAGANGERGPLLAVVHQDRPATGPVYVQIAEGDASGEGAFTWAAWGLVPD
jgi:hypothetical protein